MDWLKKLLGLSDRPWHQPPDYSPHTDYPDDEFYGQHPRGMEDSFTSMFSQMDDVFGQMNNVFAQMDSVFGRMGGYQHQQFPGQVIITEIPEFLEEEEEERRTAPRDQLLKVPDSQLSQDPHQPPQPYNRSDCDNDERGNANFPEGPPVYGEPRGFHMIDPMSLFQGFFKDFGLGSFGRHPDQPMLPGPEDEPSKHHSRDSLLKKDSDLDDRDVSQLLREGPQYSYEGKLGSSQVNPGQSKSVFRSSITTRIRRPDGSIREERRYTDSSGHEEVVVTDTRPEDSS